MAWGVGPGDAVYVPAFTFASTAEAVVLVGATPIFVDVRENDFTLDPDSLIKAVAATSGLKPRAVIPVDLFGQPADYEAVQGIADESSLLVLADAAQSFGASLGGTPVGSLGDASTTSFFPAKPLGCYGDGGAIFTNDDEVAQALRSIRVHGRGSDKYDNVRIGMNGRLDTLQAAILQVKLGIYDEELMSRQRIADVYSSNLDSIVAVPTLRNGATSAWAQYTVRMNHRDSVASMLKAKHVPTAVYYPRPLHLQTAYRPYPKAPGGLKVSERLSGEVLSLPMHPYISPSVQARIIDGFHESYAASTEIHR
jgi:dTDP-4-amino-4,6-dideoxygalactose transaminase